MTMTPEELGRMMMSNAGSIDDDAEFNRWAKLSGKLISMGTTSNPRSVKDLSPEEQQVLSRVLGRFGGRAEKVA